MKPELLLRLLLLPPCPSKASSLPPPAAQAVMTTIAAPMSARWRVLDVMITRSSFWATARISAKAREDSKGLQIVAPRASQSRATRCSVHRQWDADLLGPGTADAAAVVELDTGVTG